MEHYLIWLMFYSNRHSVLVLERRLRHPRLRVSASEKAGRLPRRPSIRRRPDDWPHCRPRLPNTTRAWRSYRFIIQITDQRFHKMWSFKEKCRSSLSFLNWNMYICFKFFIILPTTLKILCVPNWKLRDKNWPGITFAQFKEGKI